jgi:hypothetical protein
MKLNCNRKNFLYGSGAFVLLPALESLGFKRFLSAESNKKKKPPKRIAYLGFGWGVTQETWYPDKKQTGEAYILPDGLKPLNKLKKDITIVQGCTHKYSHEAHWGSTFWLTGANRYGVPGQSFANTISADQVAAKQLGRETRFSSLQLCSKDKNSGHGPGLSLAWNQGGKPLAGLDSPVQVYHRLFSAEKMSLSQRIAELKKKRSVLDTVLLDAKHLQKGLSKNDTEKLDEYYQSIRDIEIQLSKDEKWMTIPKQKAPLTIPKNGLKGYDEIKLMYDLMVAAFQTDNTRVITYRQPVSNLLKSMSIATSPHNMSHYTPGKRMEASQKRDVAQSELLAGLINKMKAIKEIDGSTLFDNVALAYGSNIRSIHYLNNCPTILTGGGANIALGQHIVLKKDTPLNNVWLTMLKGIGIDVEQHGDSTGVVKELLV